MALYKNIMPYFDELIHVYGWYLSMWFPLKIWTPKCFTITKILGTQFLNPGEDPDFICLEIPIEKSASAKKHRSWPSDNVREMILIFI